MDAKEMLTISVVVLIVCTIVALIGGLILG